MDWDQEAEGFLARVPRLVRPLARRKVEQYARSQQATRVTEQIARRAYEAFRGGHGQGSAEGAMPAAAVIESLEAEAQRLSADPRFRTRHYRVRPCAGAVGCPRALIPVREVADILVQGIAESGFAAFLEAGLAGRPILSHHRFQAAVAGCPNACSQPQIQDFGVIGAAAVSINAELCDGCLRCVKACAEHAITVTANHPAIDLALCIGCADCVRACPTGALAVGEGACRILVGGKLGRHPRLAQEVARVAEPSMIGDYLARCLRTLMTEGKAGERLAVVLERVGLSARDAQADAAALLEGR